MKFNELLKAARKKAKTTQVQLADKVNVTQGTIANWERGVREPDLDTIKRIAHALDVPPEYFIKNDSSIKNETVIMQTETTPYPTNAVKADPAARTPVQFWGKVSAGVGAYAEGIPIRTMAADDEDMQEGYEYAWLEVEGDSMFPDLQDGDYILVRVQDTAQSGDMVVALVDNGCETDGLVKRIEIEEGNHLALISTNPAYPPRVFIGDRMNDVRIFGVVVSSKRKWR